METDFTRTLQKTAEEGGAWYRLHAVSPVLAHAHVGHVPYKRGQRPATIQHHGEPYPYWETAITVHGDANMVANNPLQFVASAFETLAEKVEEGLLDTFEIWNETRSQEFAHPDVKLFAHKKYYGNLVASSSSPEAVNPCVGEIAEGER